MKKLILGAAGAVSAAAIIVLLTFCTTAPVPESKKPSERKEVAEGGDVIEEVQKLIREGDPAKALELYEKHYSVSGTAGDEGAEDLLVYGLLLYNAGRLDEAGEVLKKADRLDPGNREILYNRALVEGNRGNEDTQEAVLTEMAERFPDDADTRAALGEYYLNRNMKTKAREYYRKALEIDSEHIAAGMGIAGLLFDDRKYDEARKQYDRVLEVDPENALAYSERGRSRMAVKDYEGAAEDLSRAIELDPDYYWNYLDRGRMRLRSGNSEGALEDFTRAVELDDSIFFPFAYRAGIYEQRNMTEEAISDYERTVSLKPDYYFAHSSLGTLYFQTGEWLKSADAFKEAAVYMKEDHALPLLAAVAQIRGGKTERAREYLQTAQQRLPREDIFYHLYRLFTERGYENNVMFRLEKETDDRKKYRALFYLGEYYLIHEKTSLARIYLLEARDRLSTDIPEARLADSELERIMSNE